AVAVLVVALGPAISAQDEGTTYLKVRDAHSRPHGGASNLIYHGGPVELAAQVYIVYWGSEWNTGFTGGGVFSGDAQAYVNNFFGNVGGSSWAASTTQYCQGAAMGATQCAAGASGPTNPANELVATWTDPSAVPLHPTGAQIAAEALNLANHFNAAQSGAQFFVLTPSGHSQKGFGTVWCAYHSSSGNLSFAYMPYQPDAGANCGANFVNSGAGGLLDGFSIVGGHEYAETITDPQPNSGWLDSSGAENGDKCAWISSGQGAATDISLGNGPNNQFAVQSLWSNAFNGGAGGCVVSFP
ncbi:MAG TPA: hypothetical protein VHO95_08040, partial [Candidatus Dormibacteraeota bacterium]|nr:hypothetical protein [Candidatus Dormibacteraeota bacterium]